MREWRLLFPVLGYGPRRIFLHEALHCKAEFRLYVYELRLLFPSAASVEVNFASTLAEDYDRKNIFLPAPPCDIKPGNAQANKYPTAERRPNKDKH